MGYAVQQWATDLPLWSFGSRRANEFNCLPGVFFQARQIVLRAAACCQINGPLVSAKGTVKGFRKLLQQVSNFGSLPFIHCWAFILVVASVAGNWRCRRNGGS